MSLYTETVQKVFKSIRPPYPNFIVDMVEYEDYLSLRVYKDNIESFSENQKIALAEYLYQLRDAIRSECKCHIEGVESAPPSRRRQG